MTPEPLEALLPRYDGFLIDQYGVLVGGDGAYPYAAATLARLTATGKPALILSNSGKRSAPNEARLTARGIPRDSYLGVLSSGEAAHAVLSARIGATIAPGAPTLVLVRDDEADPLDGLDLTRTDDPAAAALVLIAGSQADTVPLDSYAALLTDPARRGVPCLCTNPDLTMLTAAGPAPAAGRIAALYQDLGGAVEYFGKPHPPIYRTARHRLGDPDPARILCIGDSPEHDIAGGKAAGCATALVRTGIHADTPLADVLAHCATIGAMPDHILTAFRFGD